MREVSKIDASLFSLKDEVTLMPKYKYEGPVMEFDNCIANKWTGETIAPSKNKARSNLAYQFKKQNNRVPSAKVKLPGKLILTEV